MPMCNRCLLRNVRTLLATSTRVSVPMGPEWVLRHAGLIQVPLRYHLPVSLATPHEISCRAAVREFDAELHNEFAIAERRKITVGVEAYYLFNHPNFGVPINTQGPLTLGGNGDAVLKDAAVISPITQAEP
jgi:hypothetical protein